MFAVKKYITPVSLQTPCPHLAPRSLTMFCSYQAPVSVAKEAYNLRGVKDAASVQVALHFCPAATNSSLFTQVGHKAQHM